MTPKIPHYLLFSEASRSDRPVQTWRFVLQNVETQHRFSATDSETTDCSERLELLAVVRGLEAIDGPAHVTLVTKSRYVSRGLKSGLAAWRSNNWCWERFGRIVPVRDHDLWRRVDQAMQYHTVNCQAWQFDEQLDTQQVEEQSQQRIDSPAPIRAPKYHARHARRALRRIPLGRQLVHATATAPTTTVDKLWTNVKSLAQTMTGPALEPTA
jgi:ribonuclease HI